MVTWRGVMDGSTVEKVVSEVSWISVKEFRCGRETEEQDPVIETGRQRESVMLLK